MKQSTVCTGVVSLALALALVLGPGACGGKKGTNPPKKQQQRQVILNSVYDDKRAGAEASQSITAQMGIVQDPALTAYVREIGDRLARFAPARPWQYSFAVVDQAAPNAFALPGGYVYVSRGLLALAGNEDELACVIGHEITHAAERHAAAQQAISRRGNPLAMPYMKMAKLAAYGRQQEHDADRGGQILAAKAGYDPKGMSDFMERLKSTERYALGASRIPGWFDTHPGSLERVATTAGRAGTLDWKRDPTLNADRASYLKHIDGLVMGPSPAEGIFRGSAFLHPDMDFRLDFPGDWRVGNSPTAVGASAPTGDAIVFLKAGPGGVSAREAAEAFAQENGDLHHIQLQQSRAVRLGNVEAWRMDVEAHLGRQPVAAILTFIPHDDLTLRIVGVAPKSSIDKFRGRMLNTARSFRRLTPEELASFQIERLRVAEAAQGETLGALAARTGSSWPAGRIAILNGTHINLRFYGGERVKIVRAETYVPTKPRPPSPTAG